MGVESSLWMNMAEDLDILWSGQDTNGIECQISRRQWQEHVAKRPEIDEALELTKAAMRTAEEVPSRIDVGQPMKLGDTFAFFVYPAKAGGLAMFSLLVSNMFGKTTTGGSSSTRVVGTNAEKRTYEDPGSWV